MNTAPSSTTKKKKLVIWVLLGAAGFFALILVIVVAGGKLLMHQAGLAGDNIRVEDASKGTFQVKSANSHPQVSGANPSGPKAKTDTAQ